MSRSNSQIDLSPKQVFGIIAFGLAGLFIVYLAMAGTFSVAAHEQAVVLRFGKYLRTDEIGRASCRERVYLAV